MSFEEINSIDIISVDETGQVILTVSDHLEWCDNLKHQKILQAKLKAYLRFVESGEILESYPCAKDRRIAIRVVFKFAPNQEALEFLSRVRKVIERAGVPFCHEPFAGSFDN
jgi:uncharacterized protein DUF6572